MRITQLKNPIKLTMKFHGSSLQARGGLTLTVSLTWSRPRLFPPFVLSAVDAVCELTTDESWLERVGMVEMIYGWCFRNLREAVDNGVNISLFTR